MKTEKTNDPDRYERDVKSWYGRLRDTWERAPKKAVEGRRPNALVPAFRPKS